MSRLRLVNFVLFALIIAAGSQVYAGIPSPEYTTAAMANDMSLTLFNLPSGTGSAMTAARDASGATYDATITVEVRDTADYLLPGMPAEDIYLVSSAGGLFVCSNGTIADAPTDANGITTFSGTLGAGGHSVDTNDLCQVTLSGVPIATQLGMTLYFNSADVNGDGTVDILDITTFQPIYSAGYDPSVDLDFDGVLDILDITRLTTAWLNVCN